MWVLFSRFVFPDGTSFASLKGVDTSELMQYSQFTTAQMPNKQNGTDVGQGTGSGLGTDRKSSKWGNYEDSRGGEDGREVDRSIHRINDSKRDKDSDRERDRAVGEVRAMDEDDSAELLSYFEGMYTTKSRRTSTGTGTEIETSVPVVSRPLSILEERRITGDHSSLSRARGDSTVDSKTASGVTKPLREVIPHENISHTFC